MTDILIAFITGLTTGGLSCLAVQGGLLASSLSSQIEKTVAQRSFQRTRRKRSPVLQTQPKLALPILVFLLAKILAYSVLGFLLGLAGQVFQLSIMTRAILQIGIGIFMFGNAMRMLNVHPIFRFFAIEPPAFLRRKIRKTANTSDSSSLFAPAWLGFLTVLIPCGVTQAMMAVALGSGDPVQGAILMFAFTLGTSPVFFAVAYFTTKLGEKLEKNFMRFTAVIIMVLAIITINNGLTLTGSPFSLSQIFSSNKITGVYRTPEPPPLGIPDPPKATPEGGAVVSTSIPSSDFSGEVTVTVENYGYVPDVIHVPAGQPFKIKLVTNNVRSCSRAFVIPTLGIQEILDSTGVTTIDIPAYDRGTRISFSCSMGMYGGFIIFDL